MFNRLIFVLVASGIATGAYGLERVEQGNLLMEDIPPIPQTISQRLQQYQNTRSANHLDWLPDGKGLLISTRFGETAQLHVVDHAGGARRQITFFNEPVTSARFSPRAGEQRFLFSKDIGGNEFYQIFEFDMLSGRYRMLTDGESRHGGVLWSRNGEQFAFYSTKRDGKSWDIYLADANAPDKARLLLQVEGAWMPLDWSPDNKQLLLEHYVSRTDSRIYVLDLASGNKTQVNPGKEAISYGQARFAPDGKGLYLSSDQDSEFRHLRYYDLKTGELTLLSGDIAWDVSELDISRDGRYLAFATNEGGIYRLRIRDLNKPGQDRIMPKLPIGRIDGMGFSPDGKRLAISINTATSPRDVYVYDIGTDSLSRWTHSEIGGLASGNFVAPELIHYPTFDKAGDQTRRIPAFVYKPAKVDKPVPVVILIHGGPESQFRPYFSAITQYLVNELGVALIAPNVRGSAGYGKSWLQLDNGYKREDSVKDIGALLDWIATQKDLDAAKVIVYGGSYGGYMVLASMTHYSDRLLGGIDVVGISNFVTFLKNTKSYRRDLRRAEYGDERDPKMHAHLQAISPNNNAGKITKPLLVVQGLNDPRVPASESEQMVNTIRGNGGEVWYLLAKDEGHGFRKKNNRDVYYATVASFVEQLINRGR